jgi:hypothetical protein
MPNMVRDHLDPTQGELTNTGVDSKNMSQPNAIVAGCGHCRKFTATIRSACARVWK